MPGRAVATEDPRLRLVWIGHFICLSRAMAAIGGAIADIRAADLRTDILAFARLRLLELSPLPAEGALSAIRKTTSRKIPSQISNLQQHALSSPVYGRGVAPSATEGEQRNSPFRLASLRFACPAPPP